VQEFQRQFDADDDSEQTSLPPAAVVDTYVKDVNRIISELADTSHVEVDKSDVDASQHESLATTALALRRQNESLQRSVERVRAEKRDLEKQLTSVERMVTLARELKDENQALIRDFRGLKDCIVVEQEADANEIVELTKSFRELMADNEMLRRQNEQRLVELADTPHRFTTTSSGAADARELTDATVNWETIFDKSAPASSLIVEKSRQAASDKNAGTQMEETPRGDLWRGNTPDDDRRTQTEETLLDVLQTTSGEHMQLKTSEGKETCDSAVAELISGVRRRNDEMSRLHRNLQRMDRVLCQMTKTTSATPDAACLSTDHQEQIVRQATRRAVCKVKSTETVVNNDVERVNCDGGETTNNVKPDQEFPRPLLEGEAAPCKWVSRQASTDSGVSRGRSFKEHDISGSVGDSTRLLVQLSVLQSETADADLTGPSTAAWEQLVADNRCLRSQLDTLMASAAHASNGGDHRADSDGKRSSPQQRDHTAQLESEVAALKQTVKEQSAYLQLRHPDDHGIELQPWAQPYDYNGADVDSSDRCSREDDKAADDDKGTTVDALRRQNALLKDKLEEMTLKWNEHEASVDEARNGLQLETTVRLDDQQLGALLDELAAKTKQLEDFEEQLSKHQTAEPQTTPDEVTNSYWSVLEDIDSRRSRLMGDNVDFDSRTSNEERTIQVFSRRLEGWLKDYEALLGRRDNVQRVNGDVVDSIPDVQFADRADAAAADPPFFGYDFNKKNFIVRALRNYI